MKIQLGKIKRNDDLRSVWGHEALDFTKWLCEDENLELLSEEIGIDIELEERESEVGRYNVDIFAKESNTGRKIIIENQLETTDHDHLGKIITYASGKDAEIIIWIVKNARDEHKQAIEWLNLHTDDKIGFFLLEIQLWQINNSEIAPKFCIIESPNEWAKAEKQSVNWGDSQCLNFDYWNGFKNYISQKYPKEYRRFNRKVRPSTYFDVSINCKHCFVSLNILQKNNTINAGLYIPDNKDLFFKLQDRKDKVENILGGNLVWHQAKKATRIINDLSIDISDRNNWETCWEWQYQQYMLNLKILKEFSDLFE